MAKVFMQGNQAMAESAIRAGCKLFFGYPITPSSEVPEYYARVMRERPEEGVTFIQACLWIYSIAPTSRPRVG